MPTTRTDSAVSTQLDQALASLRPAECIAFFESMDEKQRKAVSARALQWLEVSRLHNIKDPEAAWWLDRIGGTLSGMLGDKPPKRIEKLFEQVKQAKETAKTMPPQAVRADAVSLAEMAVLASATWTEIKRREVIPPAECCTALLTARNPKWLPEWANWVCQQAPDTHWSSVRDLERAGLLQEQPGSNYFTAMALTLAGPEVSVVGATPEGVELRIRETQILQRLTEDAELRPRVFEMLQDDQTMRALMMQVPFPTGRMAWTTEDQRVYRLRLWLGKRWQTALINCVNEGILDKHELLTTIMPVFVRFNLEHSDSASTLISSWFTELHDQVSPSPEQRNALLSDYLRLLATRNPKVLVWALDAMQPMSADPEFPVGRLCETIPAIFTLKGKEHSAQALKFLKALADSHPDDKSQIALATAEALTSESQEIQKRALVVLEKLAVRDESLIELVSSRIDGLAVMHRERAIALVGKNPEPPDQKKKRKSNVVPLRAVPEDETANTESAPVSFDEFRSRLDCISSRWTKCFHVEALQKWLQSPEAAIPELHLRGDEYPRLSPDTVLPVVNSLDDLIFFASDILHRRWGSPLSSDDIEILIDGIARFGHERPADFAQRTEAIKSEAQRLGMGYDLVCCGIVAWLTGELPVLNSEFLRSLMQREPGMDDIIRQRFAHVGKKAFKCERTIVLSTPTHKGGWIAADSLVERLRLTLELQKRQPKNGGFFGMIASLLSTKDQNDLVDECLALLRLAPDGRDSALAKLNAMHDAKSEFAQALRYALGASGIRIGENAALWIAAARARHPFSDDKDVDAKHPDSGPDGALLCRYKLRFNTVPPEKLRTLNYWTTPMRINFIKREPAVPDRIAPAMLTVLRQRVLLIAYSNPRFIDWTRSIHPLNSDGFYAEAIEAMAAHDGNDSVGRHQAIYLQSLFDPDVPITRMALLMMLIGATSKQKDEHSFAVESLIAAIEDGRLTGERLGAAMRELHAERSLRPQSYVNQGTEQLISITRWGKALKPVSLASPYHAAIVGEALQEFFKGDSVLAGKDMHFLVELLLEVLMDRADWIRSDAARSYLDALGKAQPSGKTAKLVKQLLALKENPQYQIKRAEVVEFAVERRVERSDRWSQNVQEAVTTPV